MLFASGGEGVLANTMVCCPPIIDTPTFSPQIAAAAPDLFRSLSRPSAYLFISAAHALSSCFNFSGQSVNIAQFCAHMR
jgi:hypothetical protein